MEVVAEGRIKGAFPGWGKGKMFALDSGFHRKWQQVEERDEFAATYQPKVKLLRDGARFYLEVEGMGDMVEVTKAR